jgi:hypothetical protein
MGNSKKKPNKSSSASGLLGLSGDFTIQEDLTGLKKTCQVK